LLTVTVTQQLSGGVTDSTLADGSLSGGGFLNNGDGTYTLSGVTATDATADLQALIFTPTRGAAGLAVSTTFAIQVSEDAVPTTQITDSETVVTVTGDAAPILTGANNFPAIPENDSTGTSETFASLISGQSSDADGDTLGIAVTEITEATGSGVWQYSSDGGSHWSAINTGVSATSALLLAPTDQIRFVPNDGFVGEPLATITFLAWDQTTGGVDTLDDTTQSPGSGGFSANTETASVTVFPVLSISGTGSTSILDDQTARPFENGTVNATIGDSHASDLVTITVTQQTGGATDSTLADGSLSGGGFVNNGEGTYTLSGVTATMATADLQALVFTPTRGTAGVALNTTFQIQVTDSFAPLNTVADSNTVVSVTGDATPILTGANNLPPIPENDATPAGATVASLISGQSSDSDGDTLGIAVTNISESAGSGVWQYSTDGGSHWSAISTTASATSALLLAPSDRVRFLPNDGFVGEPLATITFLAWDQTTGTVDMLDDTTQLPGSRGFSTNTETASITVFPVLSISGTGASSIKDDQSVLPFANGSVDATIGDSDPADLLTITITQQTGGATDSTHVNGALSSTDNFAGFVDNGDGTYTLTVAAPDASAELQALLFIPNQGAVVGQTIDTTFQISVADSFAAVNNTAVDSASVVHVKSTANPILTGSNNLPPIPENDSSPLDSGTQVSNLPIGAGSSSDIAVMALDDTNGLWEYSTDDTHWMAIDLTPPSLPHTGPTPSYAFLLASSDFVRFLPNTGFVGNSTFTYLAWDQDSGLADQLSPEVKPLNGTLSKTTATASITVYPVLSIQGTGASASLDDQTSQPFKSATIGDSFSSEMVTITITQINAGTHSVDSTYADGSLSSPDVAFASNSLGVYTLTIAATDATTDLQALIFAPTLHQVSPGQTVATQFTIQVSDAIFAPINTVVDQASVLTVTANAVPQLTGANNFASIPEGVATAADAGKTVASLISGKSSDTDGDVLGIAISQVDDTNGEWDYSTGVGQPWIPITGVSLSSVLLLAPTDLVRFFPNATFFGNATIQFSAWDQTVGTSTKMFDSTALPGSGAFSTNTATATIQVVAPATIFVESPAQTTNDETPVNVFASAFGSQMVGLPAPGITDPNTPIQNYTVTVTIGTPANGVFQFAAGSGWSLTSAGTYKFTGSAAAANLALEGLVFVPTIHQVEPGDSVVTNFSVSVNDAVTVPTSNSAVSLTATAVNDAPTLVAASALFNVPVLAGNGAIIGADVATEVDFDPHISYAITAGNPNGAYAIDSNGTLTVANSAALVYSATPTVLTITATNSGANGVAPAVSTSTRSIALWEITASASAIGSDSSTMLSVALISGTPLTVPVTVDWGDGSTTRVTLSSTTPTSPIAHVYLTNPNQADPSASIPINVLYTAVGQQFDTETFAAVDGTGIGFIIIPHSVSSFVTLAPPPSFIAAPTATAFDLPDTDSTDVGVAQSQITIGADRRIVLRIISPLEVEGKDIQLPDRALNDLPGLFKKLPDGHYRVYLLEDGHERLVIDVLVRQGRPVDSSEDSGGAGDRPPTSQIDTGKSKERIVADLIHRKKQPRPAAGRRNRVAATKEKVPGAKPSKETRIVALPGSIRKPSMRTAGALSLYKVDRAQAGHVRLNRPALSENSVFYVAAAAGTSAAAAVAIDSNRMDRFLEKLSQRSLSKGARLARQDKRTIGAE
jgi:phage terminase large subunit-like protein